MSNKTYVALKTVTFGKSTGRKTVEASTDKKVNTLELDPADSVTKRLIDRKAVVDLEAYKKSKMGGLSDFQQEEDDSQDKDPKSPTKK